VNTTPSGGREGARFTGITPRRNYAVNGFWDERHARDLYKPWPRRRSSAYAIEGLSSVKSDEALKALAALLKASKGVALIASAFSSVEEQWLLKKLVEALPAAKKLVYVAPHYAEGDGLLISADRTPNLRGALLTGLVKGLAQTELSSLKAAVDAGEVDTVLSVNESVTSAGLGIEA
jgi:NADH-quinone oxidoreductase subunit G